MGRHLRVTHVVCTDAFAGVERYVSTLAAGQAGSGLSVVVVGGAPDAMPAALAPAGVAWFPGGSVPSAVAAVVRAPRPDIVHVHMTAAELAGWVTRPWTRAPLVSTRHFARTRGSSLPARLLGRTVARSLAGQIAISQVVADRVEGRSLVIPSGTPDVAGRVPAAEREPTVLVVQRLEAEKSTDVALRAWHASGLAGQGWTLQIAGDGAEAARLRALASELGIEGSCAFLGHREETAALYREASIFLAPSPNDGLGLAVLEAMAAGLPVVAAGAGGHLETVGSDPGAVLFAPGDAEAAGRSLADLAGDPGRRDDYGARLQALQRREHSVASQVEATIAFYQDLVAGRREAG